MVVVVVVFCEKILVRRWERGNSNTLSRRHLSNEILENKKKMHN